jgi:hypothetical protein
MGDPNAGFSIHKIGAKIGTVPTRNAGVRIRIGGGVLDIGRVAHDAERDVSTAGKNEMAHRFSPKCKDRFAIFRRVYVFHQEPRSDERVPLANLGGAHLHTEEKQQSAAKEDPPARGIQTSPL